MVGENKIKVLFIGEYSGVYTELIKGLKRKGFNCFIISDGDGYKKYPSDILLINEVIPTKNFFKRTYRNIISRLGLNGLFTFLKRWDEIKKNLCGYDIVQLVNSVPLSGFGSVANLIMMKYVQKNNKYIFLSVLGDDYYTVMWLGVNYKRSNFFKDNNRIKNFIRPSFQFIYKNCLFYKRLNDYIIKISSSIIPGLLCYKRPYDFTNKTTSVFPFPIDKSKIGTPIKIQEDKPIVIFHGWQKGKDLRKGNDVFDRVIKKVVEKYGNKVEYRVVQSVPFDDYIKLYSNAHIFIDQLYADDKGVNGLLGMAAGKVVFAGFEKSTLESYPNYNGEIVGIDSYNDEEYLFNKFCELIDNPKLIEEISKNAIEFVKNNHLTDYVADLYIKEWKKFLNMS
jgi:glycosyltransferase involved in cell wall biosynthesis